MDGKDVNVEVLGGEDAHIRALLAKETESPKLILARAIEAAKALQDVINKKKDPVKMGGEIYLEIEDWSTLGNFYNLAPRITSSTFVQYGNVQGFEAKADTVDKKTGAVITSAEAMCLNDEDKWSTRTKYEWVYCKKSGGTSLEDPGKEEIIWVDNPFKPGSKCPKKEKVKVGEVPVPLFQLRSMAQTRAAAKALRLALGWVVVLAGYKPTPSEELDGMLDRKESAGSHNQPPEPGKHPEKAEPTKAELDALEATRKAKAAQYAKDHPQGAQAGGQAPPAGDKQEAKTAIGFVEKRNDANGGGYVTYELDNYQQEDGRFKIRFATKDATIIETLDKKFNAGERVSFEYITVPWKKGTKSGLNYEITQVVSIPEPAAAQPGD